MDGVKDEFLSEEDLDLSSLSEEELHRYWDLWLRQAQSTNDLDAHLYSHGVFVEEPRIEPFPPRPDELRALHFLLAGSGETLVALRTQLSVVRVRRRSITTAGFWLYLEPPSAELALAGAPSFDIGDVLADVRGLEHGMGLILWVERGIATALEGFTFDEELPWDWELVTLRYVDVWRNSGPPIERPAGRLLESETRETPPPYPRS
jgi:hypothetical protein